MAQTTPSGSHFYVGVGANLLSNTPANNVGVPRLVGPALTAGVQLNPHLALQAGVSYQWKNDLYSETYLYSSPTGPTTAITYSNEERAKYFFMPVLLRYTFTPSAERFHVDALGGVTLLYASLRTTYDSNPATTNGPDTYKSSDFRANLTLGPAVRYALSPQVELTASSLVSAVLGESYNSFSDRLFLNTAIGVHYTFGQH